MTHEQANTNSSPPSRSHVRKKRPYDKPALEVFGSVEELTLGGGSTGDDGIRLPQP